MVPEDRNINRNPVVRYAPPEPGPERDDHLKRADEEQERALAAPSPGIAALHVELGRLHAAAIGGKGFEPGLLARIIDEAPDAGASSLKRVQCGGAATAAITQAVIVP